MKRILIALSMILLAFPKTQAFTVAMTGDMMMGTTIPENCLPPNDGCMLFNDARATIRSADFAFGNLEGTLCDTSPTPRPCTNPKTYFIFKMPQKYANNLVMAGFDAVNIATNHINDFGAEGRDSTMASLKAVNIAFTGLKGRCETGIVFRSGKKVGICSFCDSNNSVSSLDIPYAVSLVKSLRDKCDYVIVSFHGGGEGTAYLHVTRQVEYYLGENRGNVYALAHACIDAGADIVFGHGPHLPRALELYDGHIIAYSLGNFCTPYRIGISGIFGYAPILVAEIDDNGKFVSGRIESYIQQRGVGPVRDKTEKAAELMRDLSLKDFPESRLVFNGNLLSVPTSDK